MTPCRVYWGSHGCSLPRGHKGNHRCDCAKRPPKRRNEEGQPVYADGSINVGTYPYYGSQTSFYGEDVSMTQRTQRTVEQRVPFWLRKYVNGDSIAHVSKEFGPPVKCISARTETVTLDRIYTFEFEDDSHEPTE